MTDKITLTRQTVDYAAHALEHFNKDTPDRLVSEIIHHLRTALAAEPTTQDIEALRRDAESLESLYHPATEILIEGLKKIGTEDAKRVLSAWDSGREIFDNRFLSRRNTR